MTTDLEEIPPDRLAYLELVQDRHRPVVDKDELILGHCRDRSVLDIGCIDHTADRALEMGQEWLHRRISDVASEAVGLDIAEHEAKALNEAGFDIVIGDAEDFDLGRTFDVVVAGDLIEHMSNPGRLLDAARRHLGPKSLLVVTTPNPFNVEQPLHVLGSRTIEFNPQHTLWLDPIVSYELFTRAGLDLVDFHWIDTRFHYRFERPKGLARIANRLVDAAMGFRSQLRRDFALVARAADQGKGRYIGR